MVTYKHRAALAKKPALRPFFLKEWRKFMGTKPTDLAVALGIERQSSHRLEKSWWTLSAGEIDTCARVIGVKPSQFWFPPPKAGQEVVSLDDMVEEMPETLQRAAIAAVRGIAGK